MQTAFNSKMDYTIPMGTEEESNFLLNSCSFAVHVTTQN